MLTGLFSSRLIRPACRIAVVSTVLVNGWQTLAGRNQRPWNMPALTLVRRRMISRWRLFHTRVWPSKWPDSGRRVFLASVRRWGLLVSTVRFDCHTALGERKNSLKGLYHACGVIDDDVVAAMGLVDVYFSLGASGHLWIMHIWGWL